MKNGRKEAPTGGLKESGQLWDRHAGHEAAYTYSLFHSSLTLFSYIFIFPTSIFFVVFPPLFSISRYLYADPLHCNMTYLLLMLLKDDLKEYTYAARLAGLVYAVASGMNAILVSKPLEGTPRRGCIVWGWRGFVKVFY